MVARLAALAAQGLTVLTSTRYVWPELERRAWLPMSPMSRADVLRMFEAFDTLAELPRQVKMRLRHTRGWSSTHC